MNLLHGSDLATLLAPLAQQVSRDEAVTHMLPRSAVAFLHGRVALVAFVPLGFLLGVLLTEATVGQPGATGVRAGALGSAGHACTSVGIEKSGYPARPTVPLHTMHIFQLFSTLIYSH